MEFEESFRARMNMFSDFLAVSNFGACANAATDLLRASDFANYPEGVFIGEIFEALFAELKGLVDNFSVKREDIEEILREVSAAVDFIRGNSPLTDKDKKAELYDLLLSARYIVTKNQLRYFRENRPKLHSMRGPASITLGPGEP